MFVQFIVCHTRLEWECIYPLSCNANCIQRIIVKMSFWCENKNIIIRIIFLVFLFSTEKGMLFYCCTLLLRNVFCEGASLECYKTSHRGAGSDLVQCSEEEDTCIISGLIRNHLSHSLGQAMELGIWK